MNENNGVQILPVTGMPEVVPGDDVASMIADGIAGSIGDIQPGDVVMVTHKVVSKAEGALVDLTTVTPTDFAQRWADTWGKDPRQVQVVLDRAKRIVRMHHGLIIAETQHGFICANAGVDASNAAADTVVTLPTDPDGSAAMIRRALIDRYFGGDAGAKLGVIITDSFGRPWRSGIVNIAIGVSGISPLTDYRGQFDPAGYELRATVLAVADELASAAELVMHKVHRVPVALIRGYEWEGTEGSGADLVMSPERNLFP